MFRIAFRSCLNSEDVFTDAIATKTEAKIALAVMLSRYWVSEARIVGL